MATGLAQAQNNEGLPVDQAFAAMRQRLIYG